MTDDAIYRATKRKRPKASVEVLEASIPKRARLSDEIIPSAVNIWAPPSEQYASPEVILKQTAAHSNSSAKSIIANNWKAYTADKSNKLIISEKTKLPLTGFIQAGKQSSGCHGKLSVARSDEQWKSETSSAANDRSMWDDDEKLEYGYWRLTPKQVRTQISGHKKGEVVGPVEKKTSTAITTEILLSTPAGKGVEDIREQQVRVPPEKKALELVTRQPVFTSNLASLSKGKIGSSLVKWQADKELGTSFNMISSNIKKQSPSLVDSKLSPVIQLIKESSVIRKLKIGSNIHLGKSSPIALTLSPKSIPSASLITQGRKITNVQFGSATKNCNFINLVDSDDEPQALNSLPVKVIQNLPKHKVKTPVVQKPKTPVVFDLTGDDFDFEPSKPTLGPMLQKKHQHSPKPPVAQRHRLLHKALNSKTSPQIKLKSTPTEKQHIIWKVNPVVESSQSDMKIENETNDWRIEENKSTYKRRDESTGSRKVPMLKKIEEEDPRNQTDLIIGIEEGKAILAKALRGQLLKATSKIKGSKLLALTKFGKGAEMVRRALLKARKSSEEESQKEATSLASILPSIPGKSAYGPCPQYTLPAKLPKFDNGLTIVFALFSAGDGKLSYWLNCSRNFIRVMTKVFPGAKFWIHTYGLSIDQQASVTLHARGPCMMKEYTFNTNKEGVCSLVSAARFRTAFGTKTDDTVLICNIHQDFTLLLKQIAELNSRIVKNNKQCGFTYRPAIEEKCPYGVKLDGRIVAPVDFNGHYHTNGGLSIWLPGSLRTYLRKLQFWQFCIDKACEQRIVRKGIDEMFLDWFIAKNDYDKIYKEAAFLPSGSTKKVDTGNWYRAIYVDPGANCRCKERYTVRTGDKDLSRCAGYKY